MRHPTSGFLLLVALLGVLPACDQTLTTAEPSREIVEGGLTFLRFAPDSPALADTLVSFWAVRGEERSVEIRYVASGGYDAGVCLRFTVPADALLTDSQGEPFEMGDSIRITVRVVDKARFDWEFQPAGLRFDPDHPAELLAFYNWADPDFNGDGVVDERDDAIEDSFGVWRQEEAGEPWHSLMTEKWTDTQEVRAAITGFTRYALATN